LTVYPRGRSRYRVARSATRRYVRVNLIRNSFDHEDFTEYRTDSQFGHLVLGSEPASSWADLQPSHSNSSRRPRPATPFKPTKPISKPVAVASATPKTHRPAASRMRWLKPRPRDRSDPFAIKVALGLDSRRRDRMGVCAQWSAKVSILCRFWRPHFLSKSVSRFSSTAGRTVNEASFASPSIIASVCRAFCSRTWGARAAFTETAPGKFRTRRNTLAHAATRRSLAVC
jgi:hypothetical protein